MALRRTLTYKRLGYPVGKFSFSTTASTGKLPLAGVRVLDFTRILAGPYCTQMLGDMGAEVIKIEQPGKGDQTRKWVPPVTKQGNESVYFISCNRSKKSMTLDMKSSKGIELLHELIRKSDVMVENFVPGTLDKYNLDYDYVSKNLNDRLIYCSVTAYGSKGPYAKRAGYDVAVQAIAGLMHITGHDKPSKTGSPLVDIITGLYANIAILCALRSQSLDGRNGKGQKIDVNLFDSCVASLSNIASNYLMCEKEGKRLGTSHASIVPYQAFDTKNNDEQMVIAANDNVQFEKLCEVMGLEDLPKIERFSTNANRTNNRDEVVNILNNRFKEKTREEWYNLFEPTKVSFAPVNNIEQVFKDPHLKSKPHLVQEVEHPTAGKINMLGLPIEFSVDTDINRIKSPSPLLGQHTDEILSDVLGLSEEEIKDYHNECQKSYR